MVNINWTSKHTGKVPTLIPDRSPLMHGIGIYTDTNGDRWDVVCVRGENGNQRSYINARKVDLSPYYSTSPSGTSEGLHTWEPYYFDVVKK